MVAQDIYKLETPYEKKRKEIAVDAVYAIIKNDIQMVFGVAAGLAGLKDSEDYSEWKELEFYEKVLAASWGIINWLEPETYSDFRMFQRMGPICEEYARKRTALEKKKTLLDIDREQKRNYVPPIGALSTIMMKTGSDFTKQMKKGEYEKQVQFRKRIAETGPHIFDSIARSYCINQALYGTRKNVITDWENMTTVYSYSIDQAMNGTKIGYDVESETDTLYMWHQSENKVLATCHISPETKQRIANIDRTIQIDSLELCVVNGDVLPYKMALATNKNEQWLYSFHPLAKNATIDTNVVFPVYKTGITDTNILQVLGNHVFDYNKIMYQRKIMYKRKLELKKEQERIAALEAEEAERKARREKEKRQVELIVDDNMQVANWYLQNNQLQLAEKYLQKAIDTTYQYDYDYCREKMSKQLNRIRELRKPLADTSCVLSYLTYQPVQYESTNTTLELIIKKYLLSRDKKVERNHISFTLYSGEQPGSFQIEKSSRMLKNMCKEILNNVELQPLEIDDKQWNATATFDYNIEYISSIVNLVQIDGRPSFFNKNTMSSQLESSMEKMFFDKFERLDFSYDGKYKYKVTSMDINGQIRHYAELISFHCKNGPQNAWRSLLVPGWGDKYVSETGKFDIWKTVVSYGATLLGVGLYTGFVPFNNNEVQSDFYYPYYNTVEYEDVFGSSSKRVGVVLAVTGLAVWTYDVLYVWIKGTKNKKEKKQIINSITFSYDVKQNVPTVGYSFNL